EQRLLAFVTGDSTEAAKDYAFRQLFLVAGPASVETLGGLLTNHRWSHMARNVLERMEGEDAVKSLRSALKITSGPLQAGIATSLGARQDDASVETLSGLVSGVDPDVGHAAVLALGAIRSQKAADALAQAKSAYPEVSEAIPDATLACAEGLLKHGHADAAAAVYKRLATSDVPKHIKLAASRGMLTSANPNKQ
ncbi:MAG: HEAT repeat domain-containing protein, partial [Planctomycetales bacterium]|nr:HEAT repeat domain-containing protein [Planctomycetales bacterium]